MRRKLRKRLARSRQLSDPNRSFKSKQCKEVDSTATEAYFLYVVGAGEATDAAMRRFSTTATTT